MKKEIPEWKRVYHEKYLQQRHDRLTEQIGEARRVFGELIEGLIRERTSVQGQLRYRGLWKNKEKK